MTASPATNSGTGIMSTEREDTGEQIIQMLTKVCWMELETVMSYIANSINPDGLRAQEIIEALREDITEELDLA